MVQRLLVEFKSRYSNAISEAKFWIVAAFQAILITLLIVGVFGAFCMAAKTATDDINAMAKADELKAAGWSKVDAHNDDFTSAELLARKQFADKFDNSKFVFVSTNIYHQVMWKAEKR